MKMLALMVFLAAPAPDAARQGKELLERVANAKAGDVIEVAAGTFELPSPLALTKDRLTLKGAGPGRTILKASFPGDEVAMIKVGDPHFKDLTKGKKMRLATAAAESDAVLTLKDASRSPEAGDVLLVRTPNDPAFLDSIGAKTWRKQYPYVRQTLTRVKGVKGTVLTLERPVGVAFPADAEVLLAPVLADVTVQDLTLFYDLGKDPDPTRYENAKPDNIVDGLAILGAVAPHVRNLEIIDAGRHAVHLDTVLYPDVDGVTARNAWNKGKEGNGYFRVARTYYGTFKDLNLRGLRHLAIQWSSHDNRFERVDSDCDVNFHGGFTQRNEVVDAKLAPRTGHTWNRLSRTKPTSKWAPPDGPGNKVLDGAKSEVQE